MRSKREQWLLALLVLRHDRNTDRGWLASTLWPDNDTTQALFYLRKALSNLRTALGSQAFRLESPSARTLRINLTDAYFDVADFDQAIRDGFPKTAATIYRGSLLPECHEDWITEDRGSRQAEYLSALEAIAKTAQENGDVTEAAKWLRLLIDADPFRESAYRSLMQVLADAGARGAVSVVYRGLRGRLLQELNSAPSPETEALYNRLRDREAQVLPPQTSGVKRVGNLPIPMTELIGRENEIKEVLSWMKQRRMISLVGAGGVGKTRLSIAVGDAAASQFADGVWFVDLAQVSDASLIPQATAKALGISEEQGKPLSQSVIDALSSRALLLILDNCEQFPDACAVFAQSLLLSSPELKIVATSRQPLHVVGEQVLRVPSLPTPTEADKDPNSLVDFEAVRLFVDRATRIDSGFKLSKRNSADVASICRELDGIALAIEMAAARLRSLSVSEIRTRLTDRFKLLKSGSKSALPRQQTLRAAIDWSYDHLTDCERCVLRAVSVFAGGWTVEAAAAVAKVDDLDEVLDSLADKSLAVTEIYDDTTRYRLLETVRQYAAYKLSEEGETETVQKRHRNYFLTFAQEMRPKLMAADQAHWFGVLEREHDNLRRALSTSLESGDGDYAIRLTGSLARFWLNRGYVSEGRAHYAIALAHPAGQARNKDRAIALNGAGLFAWRQSDYKSAEAIYDESISICRELGDDLNLARSLNNLALIKRDLGDYDSAQAMHEESIPLFETAGEHLIVGIAYSNLGVVHHSRGHFQDARKSYEHGLAIERELGERNSISVTLRSLGEIAIDEGDAATGRKMHVEGLAIADELDDKYLRACHLFGLGRAAVVDGDVDAAKSYFAQSLPLMASLGEKTQVTEHFWETALLSRLEEDLLKTSRLLGARRAHREATGSPVPEYLAQRISRIEEELRKDLGTDFDSAFAEGQALLFEDAIQVALGQS